MWTKQPCSCLFLLQGYGAAIYRLILAAICLIGRSSLELLLHMLPFPACLPCTLPPPSHYPAFPPTLPPRKPTLCQSSVRIISTLGQRMYLCIEPCGMPPPSCVGPLRVKWQEALRETLTLFDMSSWYFSIYLSCRSCVKVLCVDNFFSLKSVPFTMCVCLNQEKNEQ